MSVRGIRGAITVEANTSEAIMRGTEELMREMIRLNELHPEEVASMFLTVTQDLNAEFPAKAIRSLTGWELVPLICSTEIPVPGSLPKCIRVMLLVNTEKSQADVQHVFLKEAEKLRPDLKGAK